MLNPISLPAKNQKQKYKYSTMVKTFLLTAVSLLFCVQLSAQVKGDKPIVPAERMVLITTEFGDIKLKLYNETPQSRDNFIKLVE